MRIGSAIRCNPKTTASSRRAFASCIAAVAFTWLVSWSCLGLAQAVDPGPELEKLDPLERAMITTRCLKGSVVDYRHCAWGELNRLRRGLPDPGSELEKLDPLERAMITTRCLKDSVVDYRHCAWGELRQLGISGRSIDQKPSVDRRTTEPQVTFATEPANGEAWFCKFGRRECQPLSNNYAQPGAPFEIKSTAGQNYILKLAQPSVGHILIFVRGGSRLKLEVPLGTYSLTYAMGTQWYGYEAGNKFFGPQTAYFKADETFTFWREGNRLNGVSVTLYKVPSGNLRTHPVAAADF